MKIPEDYITITPVKTRTNTFIILSNSDLLKTTEYIKAEINNDFAIFERFSTTDTGKCYKISTNGNAKQFCVVSDILKQGKYKIEQEESDEDQIIIYFN